jgi:uncharacterized protein (TIGR01777 family)
MRILVSGATGLVGSNFVEWARQNGHNCVALTRRRRGGDDIEWNPGSGQLDPSLLQGFDAVVHLAGDNIAHGRWTAEKKRLIRDSRVQGTALLCDRLKQVEANPAVLVSASAIGYYGNRGDEQLDEKSSAGTGFLADVCRDWEEATQSLTDSGIRVVNARLGVVLSAEGGALKQMLGPFRMGTGGIVGNGRQYWSWITVDDVVRAILFAIENSELTRAVNVVSPHPVTNREFTKTLGHVLKRPTIVPMPAFGARILLGEMADELLLASTRVYPAKLTAAGYVYRHADLESALQALLSD